MDPESWRMASSNFKWQVQQSDMTVPRTLQVNRTRYIPTERLGKRTAVVMMDDEPAKIEGRFLHVDGKVLSVGQGEIKKSYGGEKMIVMSKHSVNKWDNQVPDSLGHREKVALISCGNNVQNSKALWTGTYGLECKKVPTLNRNIARTLIPKQKKAHFQFLREDVKVNSSSCIDAKDIIHEVSGEKTNVKMEPILVDDDDDDDDESEESNLYPEISFHPSHMKIMGPNIVNYQSGTGLQMNRNKLSGQVSSREEKVHQKMLSSHRILYRDLPGASEEFTCTDNAVSSIQRKKFTNSSSSETKGQYAVSKQKDKSVGNSTFRRFLLIDSQGLPYTVVVEESKTTKDSSPTSESFSDIKNTAASRSMAPRKVYKCPVCFRIFEYLSYLQRHSIAHSQQKPHVCKICGKAFKRTSHLTRHKYTHFGGKPSQCQICNRRFQDIGELNHHQLSHTGEQPYQCEVCHMRFGEQSSLQHHLLAKH